MADQISDEEPEFETDEEVDEDFEGVTDADWAFANDPLANRNQKKFTKDDAIYGMWNDSDGEGVEDDQMNGNGVPLKKKKGRKVNFVSSDLTLEEEKKHAKPRKENNSKPDGKVSKEYASWEKYTSGIGSKLMAQMGYKPGAGLGKGGSGLVEPVLATVRKGKRTGMSYFGSEKAAAPKKEKKVVAKHIVHSDEEELDGLEIDKDPTWKKSAKDEKVSYSYKTIDQVLSEGLFRGGKKFDAKRTKVVDMTGPTVRQFEGYDQIHTQNVKPDETMHSARTDLKSEYLPELVYNVGVLVDMTESELLSTHRKLQYERDQIVNLKYDQDKKDVVIVKQRTTLTSLVDVAQIISDIKCRMNPSSGAPISLQDCEDIFKQLKDDNLTYKKYQLGRVAIPLLYPKLRELLKTWQPHVNPSFGIDYFVTWKDFLEEDSNAGCKGELDPFHHLLWTVWLPYIRQAVQNWNSREPGSVIRLMETWLPLLPSWILNNILNTLLLPRLQEEVDSWNPTTDTVPIHSWLQPWLPVMGDSMSELYPTIRHKLSSALTNWHPSDPSAKLIIQPWKGVWSQPSMDTFLLRCIFPKLSQCLSEMVINPNHQVLDPFHWVLTWLHMITPIHLGSVFEKKFFPKFTAILKTWLANSPNYNEVIMWYQGWKNLFPPDILHTPGVRTNLMSCLELMNKSVATANPLNQPGARETVLYFTSAEKKGETDATFRPAPLPTVAPPPLHAPSAALSFKDVLVRQAAEHNIIFMPLPGRYHEGKSLFKFGNTTLYLDKNVAFVQVHPNIYSPMSISKLLETAKT